MSDFVTALNLVLDPFVLLAMLGAAGFGLLIGSIPGLTATMATALLIPVTFFMDPVPAIAVIVTAVATAIFAGDIPGALLRIPGTPASAAYCDESFAMAREGRAELALGVSLCSAVIGGLIGTLILAVSVALLAELAFQFSSFEFFWLACLGLTCSVVISSGSPWKGAVSLLLGLLLTTVGYDVVTGYPRFTFGEEELMGGVGFIPVLIGMFAMSELLRFAASTSASRAQAPPQPIANVFAGLGAVLLKYRKNLARGGVVGALIGALPGAGADLAAWVAYGVSKRASKEPELYGTGHPEGLVEAGAANNAGLAGAWAPALAFGIPGDSITAIAIGVLYLKGLNPGPMAFQESPDLVNAVFIIFFLANLMLLPLGFLAIRLFRYMLLAPPNLVMPTVLAFCVVGAFAVENSAVGVYVMLAAGVLAYLMEENGFPVAPTILGLVLGTLLENAFITSMVKADGDLTAFFSRPIAAGLGAVTIALWLLPLAQRISARREAPGPR